MTTRFVLLPARPQNRADTQEVTLRSEPMPVPVALCVSLGGRPPAKISWLSPLRGEPKESETAGPLAGTVTVTSRYAVVPSSQVNGVQITCKVEHEALEEPALIPVILSVRCECITRDRTPPAVSAGFPGLCLHCPSVLSTLALGHILPCLPALRLYFLPASPATSTHCPCVVYLAPRGHRQCKHCSHCLYPPLGVYTACTNTVYTHAHSHGFCRLSYGLCTNSCLRK